jgi:Na+-translocating ferredoxin:NAD+ oxidoreductase RnfG subunit
MDSTISMVYADSSYKQLMGYAFTANSKGYGGIIQTLVGIDPNGQILGIKILSHKETPGLGDSYVNEAWWGEQFRNLPLNKIRLGERENDIQFFTGATITAKAIVSGIIGESQRLLSTLDQSTIETASDISKEDIFKIMPKSTTIEEALPQVFPGIQYVRIKESERFLGTFEVYSDDQQTHIIGFACPLQIRGYNKDGFIKLIIGFDTKGSILGFCLLDHDETSTAVNRMKDAVWKSQLIGKKSAELFLTDKGGVIETITGATISTRAVLNGIRQCILTHTNYYSQPVTNE